MRVWPRRGRPGPRGGRRPAGDGAPARPQHHDRALGLSLLHGEGPPGPLQHLAGRDQTLLPARQHDPGHVPHGRRALRARSSPRIAARCRSGIPTSAPGGSPTRAGEEVGVFYGDMFARTGKRSGAWMTSYRSRVGLLGDDIVLGSNNNNFTKPGPGEPVLISLDDAETLFHEFGHAIHTFLSNVHYPSLAGTPRDFVEYPSQVHENWVLTPEILNRFARHYQTGQPMPQALVERIERRARSTRASPPSNISARRWSTWRCTPTPNGVVDPDAFEREALQHRHAARDRDAAPAAAVRPPVLVRRLFGRLLFLPLVGDDGRRHLGGVRGDRQRLGSGDGASASRASCCRPATRPTGPRPIASSAAATPTSTLCSASAASRPGSGAAGGGGGGGGGAPTPAAPLSRRNASSAAFGGTARLRLGECSHRTPSPENWLALWAEADFTLPKAPAGGDGPRPSPSPRGRTGFRPSHAGP